MKCYAYTEQDIENCNECRYKDECEVKHYIDFLEKQCRRLTAKVIAYAL